MKTVSLVALLASLGSVSLYAQTSVEPQAGLVPTAETAIAIAVAVFKPIYGAESIASQQPFHATLRAGVWHVSGSLPAGMRGGTAQAEVNRKDGRILRVWHSK